MSDETVVPVENGEVTPEEGVVPSTPSDETPAVEAGPVTQVEDIAVDVKTITPAALDAWGRIKALAAELSHEGLSGLLAEFEAVVGLVL